ncbi:NAD(P)-dependent oxidoreductase, partial [Candidatus Sumerlaeota bacterium]|nr:NAD(P)-dependent oxidoreductase [Candidatus Sumerlaeota bacterium]
VEVLVVGSGAGVAVTAFELASRGREVLVLEEGARHGLEDYGAPAPEAMQLLYRNRGMTPIMGPTPIGYVEGRCVGGSTEINSGFWHRTTPETLLEWKREYDLADADSDDLTPHFDWLEERLRVGTRASRLPLSTQLFSRGAEAMNWSGREIPRAAPGCSDTNACASGCPIGAKQGMSVSLIPMAEAAGAEILPDCRVQRLMKRRDRVHGVIAAVRRDGAPRETMRIEADHVIVCAGPTETPALLRRSGIKFHVGDSLHIHPMLKVAACFPDTVNAQDSVLPLVQVTEFAPDISLGGAFFSPGHLAMILSENWSENRRRMSQYRRMGAYYVAAKGTGK